MFARFSTAAREVVEGARAEAARRGDTRLGTEHLLLGLLHQPRSAAAQALDVDLDAGRRALDDLDREAMAAVGVDTTGLAPLDDTRLPSAGRVRFTAAAGDALRRTARRGADSGARTLTPEHLLLGLLDTEPPDPVLPMLARLGVDPALVRARLSPAA